MRVTVHIPDALHKIVKKDAKKEGRSLSAYYADAALKKIRERERQEAFARTEKLIGKMDVADDALEVLKEERRRSSRY